MITEMLPCIAINLAAANSKLFKSLYYLIPCNWTKTIQILKSKNKYIYMQKSLKKALVTILMYVGAW